MRTPKQGSESIKDSNNALLRQRGYRLTPQRHMILRVIQETDGHLNIDQITERVQQQNPQVSVSTIYRTLELLKSLDLIHESRLPGEQPMYETIEGHAHHHLVCRRCRTTIHMDEHLLGDLHEQLQNQYHFHQMNLELMASGYCDECWKGMHTEAET